jgi:hypothetical protein
MISGQFQNLVAFLVRNETECQLCYCMAGDHSLCPLP